MTSRAIQDQQHGRLQDRDNLSPGTATGSNSQQLTVNCTVQDQQQENITDMATCHQDPEPELDSARIGPVVNIWVSSGLGVTGAEYYFKSSWQRTTGSATGEKEDH